MSTKNPRGILEAVLTEGFLKPDDLIHLETGRIYEAGVDAGEVLTFHFNSMPIGSGKIQIIDSHICGVVTSSYSPRPFTRFSYNSTSVRYPFKIVLGSCGVTLKKVLECGYGTFISFDTLYNSEENALLIIEGVPAARGVIVFEKERLGIRITTVTQKFEIPFQPAPQYYPEEETPLKEEHWQMFDFARPDLLSRDQMSILKGMHQKMRDFTELPSEQMEVVLMDQIQVREWESSHAGRGGAFYRVFTKDDRLGEEADDQDPGVLITPEKQKYPLPVQSSLYCEFQYHARRDGIGQFFIFTGDNELTPELEVSFLEGLGQIWKGKGLICTGFERLDRMETSYQPAENMMLLIKTAIGVEYIYPYPILEQILPEIR